MNKDINFDFDRQNRIGIIEAIWGEHKNVDQLKRICEKLLDKNELVFITRINCYVLYGNQEECQASIQKYLPLMQNIGDPEPLPSPDTSAVN